MAEFEIFLLAVSLAMDAFAVSICKGLKTKKVKLNHMVLSGLWFGGFQALMPLLGYYFGQAFQKYIVAFDHWVAFGLLLVIGLNMVKESRLQDEEDVSDSFAIKSMFLMAVATSIDALAVGVTFGFMGNIDIFKAIAIIGITTFVIAMIGTKIGCICGEKLKSQAELLGGLILIGLGVKILVEHLYI